MSTEAVRRHMEKMARALESIEERVALEALSKKQASAADVQRLAAQVAAAEQQLTAEVQSRAAGADQVRRDAEKQLTAARERICALIRGPEAKTPFGREAAERAKRLRAAMSRATIGVGNGHRRRRYGAEDSEGTRSGRAEDIEREKNASESNRGRAGRVPAFKQSEFPQENCEGHAVEDGLTASFREAIGAEPPKHREPRDGVGAQIVERPFERPPFKQRDRRRSEQLQAAGRAAPHAGKESSNDQRRNELASDYRENGGSRCGEHQADFADAPKNCESANDAAGRGGGDGLSLVAALSGQLSALRADVERTAQSFEAEALPSVDERHRDAVTRLRSLKRVLEIGFGAGLEEFQAALQGVRAGTAAAAEDERGFLDAYADCVPAELGRVAAAIAAEAQVREETDDRLAEALNVFSDTLHRSFAKVFGASGAAEAGSDDGTGEARSDLKSRDRAAADAALRGTHSFSGAFRGDDCMDSGAVQETKLV